MHSAFNLIHRVVKFLITLFVGFQSYFILAQSKPSIKIVDVDILDSVKLTDSMYIIPESVRILNVDSNRIKLIVQQKSILLVQTLPQLIHLRISYSTLSVSPDLLLSTEPLGYTGIHEIIPMSYKFHPKENKPGRLSNRELDYAGTFGRGLSFGNNQNLVLNSTLDLQLSGSLGDEIEINAAISDQNLPIQADGNTAQLNEIDKVYIELKRKNQTLLAGDQQLQSDQTYFLRYNKKYKGLQFTSIDSVSPSARLETKIGGAIARGNFKRQTLTIQEGNQGPYRLTGKASDLFIIVLSASEKVYLDGILLSRGYEFDYVMDYNRSEISFTARHLLNRNSRVVVEFEYSNQSYLKSSWSLQSKYHSKNLSIQWNSYQESDNKTSNLVQTLSAEDKLALQAAGDQTAQLNKSTITPLDPTTEYSRVRYRLADTSAGGNLYRGILIINQQESNKDYTAQFNFIGSGRGNYIIENNLFTNGRAYRWVAPDPLLHTPTGEYEPVTSIVAPKKQVAHSLIVQYTPENGFFSSSEINLSNLDLNLYSPRDHGDNLGLAWKHSTGYTSKFKNSGATWLNGITLEKTSRSFNFFEPYRNPEFDRNWNLTTDRRSEQGDLLTTFHSELTHRQYAVGYTFEKYNRPEIYRGAHHGWNARWKHLGTSIILFGSASSNTGKDQVGNFIRPHLEVSQNFSKKGTQQLGILFENETNRQRNHLTQQLLPMSFAFQTAKVFYKGALPQQHMDYNIEFTKRTDQQIVLNQFKDHFQAQDLTIEQNWQINNNTNWTFRLGDRKLSFIRPENPILEKNNHSLILRQALNTKSNNNAIRFYESIESNSGQEPATEYTFVKVNKGQGYYTWIDANNDSIIQVTEFELAAFSDQGEYIRYAVTGKDFVKTRNFIYLHNLEVDGAKLGNPATDHWYRKLGFISNLNYTWKLDESNKIILPFHMQQVGIVSGQGQMRHQLYFNRGNPAFELQAGQQFSGTKWRLATGFELRTNNELFLRSRLKINKSISIENYVARILQKNNAALVKIKNYTIQNYILEPKINFQTNNSFRLSASYRLKSGYETITTTTSLTHTGMLELTALSKSPWSFRSSISSIWASLKGQENPLTVYSMLQGLRIGYNALIQINIDRQINSNTILRIGYDGRKSEGIKFIQTGRAQIVANF